MSIPGSGSGIKFEEVVKGNHFCSRISSKLSRKRKVHKSEAFSVEICESVQARGLEV